MTARFLLPGLTAFLLLSGVARAAEPVIDFASIARTTQQLATQLKQLQALTNAGNDLGRMLQAVGERENAAAFDASVLGLDDTGRRIARQIEAAVPAGNLGLSPRQLGQLTWQAALDASGGSAQSLEQLGEKTLATQLQQAGLGGIERIPGVLQQIRQAAVRLGGLGDLRGFAAPQQLLSRVAADFSSFTGAQAATASTLWVSPGQADTMAVQAVTAARRRVQSDALTAGYPMALLLRTEIAQQPARLERLAADAASATTLFEQMRQTNTATLALVQSATRIEAALAGLLSIEAAGELQHQPPSAPAP